MTSDADEREPSGAPEEGGPPKRGGKRKGRRVPREDSVVSEGTLRSPKGRTYRVIRTTQKDEYEEQPASGDSADAQDAGDIAPPANDDTHG